MKICSGPWKTPTIHWDGRVTVCCRDNQFELSPGSLAENTFDELWYGEKIDAVRMNHIRGLKARYLICRDCPGQDFPRLTEAEVADYLRATGRAAEAPPAPDR